MSEPTLSHQPRNLLRALRQATAQRANCRQEANCEQPQTRQ